MSIKIYVKYVKNNRDFHTTKLNLPTGALDSRSAGMFLDSLGLLNEERHATILMVTHDAFTASHCKRILFMKDGRIFNELVRGADSRREFFDKIMQVVSLLGGDKGHAF